MILAALAAVTTMLVSNAPPLMVDIPPPVAGEVCNPVFLVMPRDGSMRVDKKPVSKEQLVPTVLAAMDAKDCHYVFVEPDPSIPYSRVLDVMWMLRYGGVTSLALIDTSGD